ncbi:S9 family peptidase [Natronorarus salvus]|uniref:S9 family peptidase n=1 Tax=Natronorarus salvus TaxID=3117733 RepID=UPI002F26ABF5
MSDLDEEIRELVSLPSFYHATASPDGERVALYYDVTGRNELHVLDVETGERERVSDGEVPKNARWHVDWSASGEEVYFHLDADGDEQNDLYAIGLDGGVEPVVEMEGQVALMDVGERGETLLLGSTAGGQMNVYGHDLASGETTKLTDYERAAGSAILSPDGERIAYATNETDAYENQDVYVANADGSDPRNLAIGETGAESSPTEFSPEGERLLVSDNSEDLSRMGIYDLETDEIDWFGGLEHEESPIGFFAENLVLVHRTREAMVVPVVYDVGTGESRELDLPNGVSSFAGMGSAALTGDRVLLTHTTPTRRPELLAYDLSTDEREVLLEAEYGPFSSRGFADAEYFEFDSHDGLEIGALLYDSGERPSPLIVNPHGGPRAADYRNFDLYSQVLLAHGYSVLQVNYRGSTGRGREFVELLYGDWGGDEQADVAAGVRHVLETRDWLDADRVAVFGGSYGGYSAFTQMLLYPELYAAGVGWIGVTDLRDMFENTMPHFRTELLEKQLGTPEENPELYDERSPVNLVENLSAPLLIVHGVNDRRVPISQARLLREALTDAGYGEGETEDFEYVELGEEGHASSDIDQKIRTFEILIDFLDRRL